MLINRSELLFTNEFRVVGPLQNNLLLVIAYITIGELLLLMSRWFHDEPHEILLMGALLILTCIGLNFYANVNEIRLNNVVFIAGILIGFVHLAYGLFKMKHHKQDSES